MTKDLVPLVSSAFREVIDHKDPKISVPIDATTPLFGRDGILDSMGLVTLVVAVEQAIEDAYGVSVSLADDRALSQRNSPYRTIGALADYAARLLNGGVSGE